MAKQRHPKPPTAPCGLWPPALWVHPGAERGSERPGACPKSHSEPCPQPRPQLGVPLLSGGFRKEDQTKQRKTCPGHSLSCLNSSSVPITLGYSSNSPARHPRGLAQEALLTTCSLQQVPSSLQPHYLQVPAKLVALLCHCAFAQAVPFHSAVTTQLKPCQVPTNHQKSAPCHCLGNPSWSQPLQGSGYSSSPELPQLPGLPPPKC